MKNIVVLLAVIVFSGFTSFSEPVIQLIQEGCFHGNEVKIDTSLRWMALYKSTTTEGYEWKKVQLQLTPCHDPIFDNDSTIKSGVSITVKNETERSLILIGGLSAVKDGALDFVELREQHCVFPGDDISFRFNNSTYSFMANGLAEYDTTGHRMIPVVRDYRLLFVKGKHQNAQVQELFSLDAMYAGDESTPTPAMVADFDRDGKPDILYNITNHYNMSNITLFLSSLADKGQMVKQVAEFTTTGC